MEEQNQINQNLEQEPQTEKDNEVIQALELAKVKGNKGLIISFVALLLMVVTGGVYWLLQSNSIETESQNAIVEIKKDLIEDSEPEENGDDDLLDQLKEKNGSYEENVITTAIWCYNMNNNQDIIKHLPENIQEEMNEERVKMEEEIQADINDGDMTEEEANEMRVKCYSYLPDDEWDFVEKIMTRDGDGDGLNLYFEYYYGGDDDKRDTDGDGYDDLAEFVSGNKLNDNFDQESVAIWKDINNILEEDNPDLYKAIDLCMEFRRNRDNCLDILYWYADDEYFCEDLPFYSTYSHDDRCYSVIKGRSAYVKDDTDACSKLYYDEYSKNVCLAEHGKIKKSLEPCTLSDNFDQCAQVRGLFSSLTTSEECINNFSNFTSGIAFNSCLYDTTAIDGNVENCYYMAGIPPVQCMLSALGSSQKICEDYGGTWNDAELFIRKKCTDTNGQLFKAFLGVYQEILTPEKADVMQIDYIQGSLVTGIEPLSLAKSVGLKKNDIITQIDNNIINAENSLIDILSQYTSEDSAELTVWSDNKYKKINVEFWNLHEAYDNMYGIIGGDYDYPYWNL